MPFIVEIPKKDRDPEVRVSLRERPEQRNAVLAWMVDGTRRWLREGLETPEAVEKATESFKDEMDPLAPFIADCCQVGDNMHVAAKELRTEYIKWCEENGVDHIKGHAWRAGLESRGFKYGWSGPKTKRVRAWMGVALKTVF